MITIVQYLAQTPVDEINQNHLEFKVVIYPASDKPSSMIGTCGIPEAQRSMTTLANLLASVTKDAPAIPRTSLTVECDNIGHGYNRTNMQNLRMLDGVITGLNGKPLKESSLRLDSGCSLNARVLYDSDAHQGVLHCSRAFATQLSKACKRQERPQPKSRNHPRKHKRV